VPQRNMPHRGITTYVREQFSIQVLSEDTLLYRKVYVEYISEGLSAHEVVWQ